ncbi:hypothetical protein FA13DRAFT_725096 [Coprinellus micaceus]|uniref:Uncharacterized protein n=1 Tax=Coprinellus micaceus TaxID=71717 RepID=A0A4Y7TVB4_COPMI|nr:hypothetical protein FA13DRAFT_725096 [Coprinellus micaceus]
MASSSKGSDDPNLRQPEVPTVTPSPTPSSSPPAPDAPSATATATTTENTLATSLEPLPKGSSPSSAPLNPTTSAEVSSHITTQRWPWMDIVDELFPGHGLDARRHNGAPLPALLDFPGTRPPVEAAVHQPRLLGYLAAPATDPASSPVSDFPQNEGLMQGAPACLWPPPSRTISPAPLRSALGHAPETRGGEVSHPISTENTSSSEDQDWVQAYAVPTRPLYLPQRPNYPDAPSDSTISMEA